MNNDEKDMLTINNIINDINNNTFDDDNDLLDIDINDYKITDDEDDYIKYVNLLNVYNCYFKQVHEKKKESTLFDDIDYEKDEATNKCMEFLYEEIIKFNKSIEEDKDLLYNPNDPEVDINIWKEMYVLYIESEQKYTCKYILPLLQFVSTLDWTNLIWNIKPLKN